LRELVHDDMIFAVFPLLGTGFDSPWFYRFSEVINAVEQVLEGINFCHERLVAHLDLDTDNILINWAGTRCQLPGSSDEGGKLGPFRSYFPVRYYINDFEVAVTFEPHSEPSSRTVTGLPFTGIRTGEYGRTPAPEMLSGSPYCPFRADIWQLGTMFKLTFEHLSDLSQPLIDLFDIMCSEVPSSRPSASEALDCVRRLVLSHDVLMSDVPCGPDRISLSVIMKELEEAKRQAAKLEEEWKLREICM